MLGCGIFIYLEYFVTMRLNIVILCLIAFWYVQKRNAECNNHKFKCKKFYINEQLFFATSIFLKGQSLCFRFSSIFGCWVLYHIIRIFQFVSVSVILYIILLLCFICENNPHYFYKERKSNISGDFQEKVILYLLLFCFLIRVESILKAMVFACSVLV